MRVKSDIFKKTMKVTNPIPHNLDAWLEEIGAAYRDAQETIPFGLLIGQPICAEDLFHLGPVICLKFRGIKNSKSNLKRATDAALSSYVAAQGDHRGRFQNTSNQARKSYACNY